MTEEMKKRYKEAYNIKDDPSSKYQLLDDCYVIVTRYYNATPFRGEVREIYRDSLNGKRKYEYGVFVIDSGYRFIVQNCDNMTESGLLRCEEIDIFKTLEEVTAECEKRNKDMKEMRDQFIKDLPYLLDAGLVTLSK